MRGCGAGTGNFKALKCVLTSHTVGVKYREYYEQIKKRQRERGEEKRMKSFQLIRFRRARTECDQPEGFGRSRQWLLQHRIDSCVKAELVNGSRTYPRLRHV